MHLLKCQIVRILHSSCIVPKGYLKVSENFKEQLEGKVTELDEEYKSPTFEEMKSPEVENWIHEHAYIFHNGKVIDPSIETQVDRMRGIAEDDVRHHGRTDAVLMGFTTQGGKTDEEECI